MLDKEYTLKQFDKVHQTDKNNKYKIDPAYRREFVDKLTLTLLFEILDKLDAINESAANIPRD